jgi:1-acyl-sn-glycerol-3-phosphate acyltransferase
MLIFVLSCLSALGAVLLCLSADAFSNLHWLWVLPAGLVGSFVLLLGLAFAFLLMVCAWIDPEKTRDQDSPWFRRMIMEYVDVILKVLPVRVCTEGLEKLPKDGRFLLVSNHLDDTDPAYFFYCFPKSQLAFVGKKETQNMFLVNKIMPKLLCPTINRENDREALKTILRCISLLKSDTVSIAIFPEGRINPYRKLAHFRPGVFKIAQKANVPIVVCTLRGTHDAMLRLKKLKGSTVHLHLLDVIQPESFMDKTTVQIANEIYEMMAQDLGPENVLTPEEEEST